MLRTLHDFVGMSDSPNLYFALSALPRPLVDIRHELEMERDILYLSYPELQELRSREFTPAQLEPIINRFTDDIASLGDPDHYLPRNRLEFATLALVVYPNAKKRLIEGGRSAAQIEAMPVFQVVMLDALDIYDVERDQLMCWLYLPYPDARLRIIAAEQIFRDHNRRYNPKAGYRTLELAPALVPALQAAMAASARADREVAMLRVIEAIRLYAAVHDAKLPRSLNEINEVPLPNDPFTNQAFQYAVTDDEAFLAPPAGDDWYEKSDRRRFEIRMAR
jgi:hypothetical protein